MSKKRRAEIWMKIWSVVEQIKFSKPRFNFSVAALNSFFLLWGKDAFLSLLCTKCKPDISLELYHLPPPSVPSPLVYPTIRLNHLGWKLGTVSCTYNEIRILRKLFNVNVDLLGVNLPCTAMCSVYILWSRDMKLLVNLPATRTLLCTQYLLLETD